MTKTDSQTSEIDGAFIYNKYEDLNNNINSNPNYTVTANNTMNVGPTYNL